MASQHESKYSRTFPPKAVYETCPIVHTQRMIRLIDILPGKSLPICCRMRTVSLDLGPQYTALSYCWGDATNLSPIYVNNRLLSITRNLHAALYYMRNLTRLRTLWVDSICINQSDNLEKNQQVAIMKEIFESAEKVVAWLGEPIETNNQVMEPMEKSAAEQPLEYQPIESTCMDYQAMRYISGRSWSPAKFITASDDVFRTLSSLFSRAFWTRVWIVQEIALGKQVEFYCGHESFSLGVLQEFLTKKLPPYHPLRGSFWKPRRLLRLALSERSSSDILIILREAVPFEASILVDKIFALRALFPQKLADSLKPEYKKPFQHLLHDFTRAYINTTENIEFLCNFPRLRDTEPGTKCPSWLPDTRARISGMLQWQNWSGNEEFAARNWPTGMACVLSDSLLQAPGRAFGRLKLTLGPFETRREVLIENFRKYGRCLQNASFIQLRETALYWLNKRYPKLSKEDLERAFFRLVAGDKVFYQFEKENVASLGDLWDATMSTKQLEVAGSRFENIFQRLQERVLFILEDGCLGIGPRDACEGDMACVLWGCSSPVLLRKEASEEGLCGYSFLGPAYIDGAGSNKAGGGILVYTII